MSKQSHASELIAEVNRLADKCTRLTAEVRVLRTALTNIHQYDGTNYNHARAVAHCGLVGQYYCCKACEPRPGNAIQVDKYGCCIECGSIPAHDRQNSVKGPTSEQDCRAVEHGETAVNDVSPCVAGPAMTASAEEVPGRNMPSRGNSVANKQSPADESAGIFREQYRENLADDGRDEN